MFINKNKNSRIRCFEPEIGEHVEIYKMRENGNQVDFIDQM